MLKNNSPKQMWVTGDTKAAFEQLRRPDEQLYQTAQRIAQQAARRQKSKPEGK